jgi:hypothetical protein
VVLGPQRDANANAKNFGAMIGAIRIALIVLFALGIVVATGDALTPLGGASYIEGILTQTGVPDHVRVAVLGDVTVTGEVRPGDTLLLGEPRVPLRTFTLVYPASATFTNLRTGATVTLADPPERPPSFRLRMFVRLILMLTALVLLVIRGRQPAVLALATYIFLVEYTQTTFSGYWLGTWGAIVYATLQGPLGVIAPGTLVYLASTFAPKTRGVKTLLFAAYIGTALFALYEVAIVVAEALQGDEWDPGSSLLDVVQIALTWAALVVFVIAARAAESGERRRILILMAAAAIGSAYTIIGLFGNAVYTALQSDLALGSVVVMEIGLAYAIVFERLFDIGFFVNRAVVYGITSAIVLLAFVAIEWLAAHEAETIGHFESSAIQLGLAVVVALSLRPIHHRVDEFVDGVIFEARHRAANALKRFAEDCGEFQEADALLRTTLATLKLYGRVSECAIFLADEPGNLYAQCADGISTAKLSVDDPTVVRLRTSRAPFDRISYAHLTIADIVFPMMRRRSLIGAIFCTLPSRSEPYSPEERDALAEVAREVGASLVALEAAAAQRLAGENAELRARLALELS